MMKILTRTNLNLSEQTSKRSFLFTKYSYDDQKSIIPPACICKVPSIILFETLM
jgi:hypothetical protein